MRYDEITKLITGSSISDGTVVEIGGDIYLDRFEGRGSGGRNYLAVCWLFPRRRLAGVLWRPGQRRHQGLVAISSADVMSRMSLDRGPTRRLSCRALPPRRVALLVIARLTVAISERHCWVVLAVAVLPRRSNRRFPRRSNRRFPKQLEEWHFKHA